MDPLLTNLLDLLSEFDRRGIPLTVGGGFGLYLKRGHLNRTGEQTLFAELPSVRSTNDIDVFLRAEVLADAARVADVAQVVGASGYTVVPEAKFFQWSRSVFVGGIEQEVKLDILVGPVGRFEGQLKRKGARVRPKGASLDFHAHQTEEALHIEDRPVAVSVSGLRSDGTPYGGTVYVPETFPYLMMKLHAFSDRKADEKKDLGRHHALDLYAVVGMMTEGEYERAKAFGAADRDDPHVRRAQSIVAEDFGNETAIGVLRLREHPLARSDFRLGEFVSVLSEVFPPT